MPHACGMGDTSGRKKGGGGKAGSPAERPGASSPLRCPASPWPCGRAANPSGRRPS